MIAIIETPRLRLAAPTAADIPAMAALANDFDIAVRLARLPHPYAEKDAENFIASIAPGDPKWAIRRREGDLFMGMIGIHDLGAGLELGYWLGRPHWALGYASEAVRAVIAHAFTAMGYEALRAAYFDGNDASRRVLEKAGFRETGRSSCFCLATGEDTPQNDMTLLKSDWETSRRR